ncbi:hypothetical protein [Gorillibacterium timonense]|uniref:hypothetical protein n=1 Tax=Gorillibacterium timonense TaxID=1689269 RepID=UPI00071DB4FA|nr:hypothetical protein [Gorillibacterium timonense]
MKKRYILALILAALVLSVFLYKRYYSIPQQLSRLGFSMTDILGEERLPLEMERKPDIRILLTADEQHFGLIGLDERVFSIWKRSDRVPPYIQADVGDGSYALTSTFVPFIMNGLPYHQFNLFFAISLAKDSPRPPLKGTDQFDLTYAYYDWNEKTLLYAHALHVPGKHSKVLSSSEDVLRSIKAQIEEAAR